MGTGAVLPEHSLADRRERDPTPRFIPQFAKDCQRGETRGERVFREFFDGDSKSLGRDLTFQN